MLDVAIVGSGPAGLSASVYANRAGLSTIVFAGDTPGGLLTQTSDVDNYLGFSSITGVDLAMKFLEHSESFDQNIEYSTVNEIEENNGIFTLKYDDQVITSKTVIYAAGATPKKLGLPNEDISGVSYCATCDGFFYKEKDVIVVGGGDTAIEDATYLTNIVNHVTVLVRGNSLRAKTKIIEAFEKKENKTILFNTEVSEIIPEDGKIKEVLLNNGNSLSTSALFIAVGQNPNSEIIKNLVKLDESGFVLASVTPGFFVSGDVADSKYRQAIIAAGSGAKAALDATEYLNS